MRRITLSGLLLLSGLLAPSLAFAQLDPETLTDDQAAVVEMVIDARSYLQTCPASRYDIAPETMDSVLAAVGLHWTTFAQADDLRRYIVEQTEVKATERGPVDDPGLCEEAYRMYGEGGTVKPNMLFVTEAPIMILPPMPAQ